MADETNKDNAADKAKEAVAKLVARAAGAYGINPKYIIGSSVNLETGVVTIVTAGGSKVRWTEADKDKVQPLSQIAVTGINPNAAKRKPIAGKAKEKE